ncbi:MAG: serine racemase VanT catalytic subunit [Lachnospiraceae bacterium]|nr:serine racemase VanT catalytic subunit [Ruminococcus sp.]MCM1276872.1 serine racemase VanT catalytic subunit [Lachnospiraceae bacterium]
MTKFDKAEQSGALDGFRMIAAVLVIAIHISPLESISADADFFLTRVLARLAVPFFFTVTGAFTDFERPKKAFFKLTKMYLAVTLLYVPLAVYSGYFEKLSFGKLIKMLLFDGCFYHLWYFPACILGIVIVHFLKKAKLRNAFITAAILYIMGIFGDSYYGISEKILPIKMFYNILFNLFSYTRNGLFFAPIYLLSGSVLRGINTDNSAKKTGAAFAASFALMTAEAFLLREFKIPRHDSMYIFLLPAALLLFSLLRTIKAAQQPAMRKISMWIYIIHPAVIIVLRGASKIISDDFFAKKELLLFALTTVFSAVFSIFAVIATRKLNIIRRAVQYPNARVWAEINTDILRKNVDYLRRISPENSVLMPAVKANAYGHGAVLIARELNKMGVKAFCVASANEGVELRRHGIRGEILVLGYTSPVQFPLLKIFRLSQTVVDFNYAKKLNRYGKIHTHIGVDTGMRRLGIRSENYDEIRQVFKMDNLTVDGIFTHLSADETTAPPEADFTEKQAYKFYEIVDNLEADGYYPKFHLLASYGLLNYAHLGGDYVRVGIALYGGVECNGLQPVLSLKTRVTSVRNVYAGEPIGYGLSCIAERDMRIAALAIGYADGLPRELSDGKGAVLINGKRAPIMGKICMDQTLADVSEIDVKQGDIAVIIGNSGNELITACEIAEQIDSIPNDILSGLGNRVVRIIR